MRNIKERIFAEDGKKYIDAAGLSTETKPTTGIVTGSMFFEVDTGDIYAFDEVNAVWHKVVESGGGS